MNYMIIMPKPYEPEAEEFVDDVLARFRLQRKR